MRQYDMALCRAATEHKSRDALKEKVHAAARIAVSRHNSGVEVRGFVQRLVDICSDPVAVKENLLFVVDSIMRHAEKESETVAKKFERAIGPHLAELFRSAVQREDTRAKVSTYLLKKLVPVWKENAWFSREMNGVMKLLVSGLKTKKTDAKVRDKKVTTYHPPADQEFDDRKGEDFPAPWEPAYNPFLSLPSEGQNIEFDSAAYAPSIASIPPKEEIAGVGREQAYEEPPVSAAFEADEFPDEVPLPTETPTVSGDEADKELPVGFRARLSREDRDLAADTPLIAGAETPRGPGATVSIPSVSIRPPTEEVPSSLMATVSSRRRDDDEQVPVPTEEVLSDLSGRRRARGEASQEAPTSPAPSTPRTRRDHHEDDVPVPTSPVASPEGVMDTRKYRCPPPLHLQMMAMRAGKHRR